MAQKLIQTQEQKLQLQQRLTAQQLLQVKLLEMPLTGLEESVRAELDDNPALETLPSEDETADSYEGVDTGDDAEDYESQSEREERADALDSALENIGRDDVMTEGSYDHHNNADYEEIVYGDTVSFYDKLKANTLENPYWAEDQAEYAPSYTELLEAIGWTSSSDETFSVTLDGIKPGTDGTVEFVADLSYFDEEYEETVEMFKVPFEFGFSAYEREKAALEAGTIGPEKDAEWLYDATVDPDFYLNCDNIAEDYYECGNWTESSAEISEDKLVFTFCIYNYNEYDYSRVVATYTPNE